MVGIILALVVAAASVSQSIPFDQFAVTEAFTGKPAPPDLSSHPDARYYRSTIRWQAQKSSNFAGHFTVVHIGCGTGCAHIAVVDAKSGRVFFPKGLPFIHVAGWWHEPIGPVTTSTVDFSSSTVRLAPRRHPMAFPTSSGPDKTSSTCASNHMIEEAPNLQSRSATDKRRCNSPIINLHLPTRG